MRILIAGGSGFIGRAAAIDLAAAGHEVVVLSRDPERARPRLAPGLGAERWDARTAAGWGRLLDRPAAILNLAGENIAARRWTPRQKRALRESRLDAARAVVEAVRQAELRPAVVLQASGIGYYGSCGEDEVSEDHLPGADFLAELSIAWEAASAEVEELGVRRVVLRTGMVLAREGGALAKMLPAFRFGLGGPLGGGRQWWPWIHLADEVGAIRFLLERRGAEARGPYNLTAPQPLRNRDFARALGRALHRPALLPAPAFALRLALGEMAEALLRGQRALPSRLLDAGYAFQHPRLDGALADLLG
ncbi:MAG TPA: TIGR01777 family oxidoreductase [Thermoanaerobaculia bacterium]|nr:TIGR01777 family oxidoreductase [Thermoanaerobaculia bacterium]